MHCWWIFCMHWIPGWPIVFDKMWSIHQNTPPKSLSKVCFSHRLQAAVLVMQDQLLSTEIFKTSCTSTLYFKSAIKSDMLKKKAYISGCSRQWSQDSFYMLSFYWNWSVYQHLQWCDDVTNCRLAISFRRRDFLLLLRAAVAPIHCNWNEPSWHTPKYCIPKWNAQDLQCMQFTNLTRSNSFHNFYLFGIQQFVLFY